MFSKFKTAMLHTINISVSGREPDLEAARKKHYKDITCQLANGEVCAKYTTYYNGISEYVIGNTHAVVRKLKFDCCSSVARGEVLHEDRH